MKQTDLVSVVRDTSKNISKRTEAIRAITDQDILLSLVKRVSLDQDNKKTKLLHGEALARLGVEALRRIEENDERPLIRRAANALLLQKEFRLTA